MDDSVAIAKAHFQTIGLNITEKAARSLATAIGLSGSIEACDEASVSIGLRKTNSVLAHLTDRLRLDFAKPDQDVEKHAELTDEREVREELRSKGYKEDPLWRDCDFDDDRIETCPRIEISDDMPNYVGVEGEPDEKTLQRLLDSGTPDILVRGIQVAKAEHRTKVETVDFISPIADLPITGDVFRRARVTHTKLQQEIARFKTLEPFAEQLQFVLAFDEGRIRLKTFGLLDGVKYEERKVNPQDLIVQIASSNAPFLHREDVEEFEELVNWSGVSERDLHRFLVQHPAFLFGDDYYALHSELILERADKGPLIPDFFAELGTRNHVDIIDLKRPNESLIVGSQNRRGLSAAVNSAIYQLREYRDYFNSSRRRKEFYDRYGLRAWYPKIAVVIGRRPTGGQYEELVRARRTVDADIITYDDLLDRARRRCLTIG